MRKVAAKLFTSVVALVAACGPQKEEAERPISAPHSGASLSEAVLHAPQQVVDRAPTVGQLSTADDAFAAVASHRAIASRAFRDDLSSGSAGPVMVAIPSGYYFMGATDDEVDGDDEQPRRLITLDYSFAVSRYEITWEEWELCVRLGGCEDNSTKSFPGAEQRFRGDAGWGRGSIPVINVNWHDAVAYVRWLSQQTGQRYRLLSEAEWEYVARAGTTSTYAFEDANYAHGLVPDPSTIRLRMVGQYEPNAFGLYDMFGNVWEWTQDCYARYSHGAQSTDGTPLEIEPCRDRALRGGAYQYVVSRLRSANREQRAPGWQSHDLGFRIARAQ